MISLAGSVITREKRSANDVQKIDCDEAIKKAAKYLELTWKVKGEGDDQYIAYCNSNRNCHVNKKLLEDKRIEVLDINSNGTLSIKRSSRQKRSHSISLLCIVETTTFTVHIREVKIYYSLACKLRLLFKLNYIEPF